MFIEHIMTFDQARKIEEDGDKNLVCTLYSWTDFPVMKVHFSWPTKNLLERELVLKEGLKTRRNLSANTNNIVIKASLKTTRDGPDAPDWESRQKLNQSETN